VVIGLPTSGLAPCLSLPSSNLPFPLYLSTLACSDSGTCQAIFIALQNNLNPFYR
jgi:hypothetical protein